MKKLAALFLMFAFTLPAFASFDWIEGSDVRYVGGSAQGIAADAIGKIDLTSANDLVFATSNAKISIPYASISSFSYTQEVAHHYGVLAATAIGLLKARRQQHFLHISYADSNGTIQSVVLEVSKDAQSAIRSTIEARLPSEAHRPRV
jgi:hypothetical protein